jgi:hypothetical protein
LDFWVALLRCGTQEGGGGSDALWARESIEGVHCEIQLPGLVQQEGLGEHKPACSRFYMEAVKRSDGAEGLEVAVSGSHHPCTRYSCGFGWPRCTLPWKDEGEGVGRD